MREESGTGIDRLEPSIRGKLHETKTGTHFSKSRNPRR